MRFNFTERLGVLEAGLIFTKDILWVYRDQPLVDVGIDALIEESVNGNPTGKFLAAQIKSGKGNVHESEKSFTHYISNVHQYYWLNLDLPIIIIAHIPEENYTCWEFISKDTLIRTGSQWKIIIPKRKILNQGSKDELRLIIKSNIQNDFLRQFLDGDVLEEEVDKIIKSTHKISELAAILEEFADILTEAAHETIKETKKINHYVNRGFDNTNRQVKTVVNRICILLNSSSNRMDQIIENFSSDFADAFGGYEKLAMMHFYTSQDYKGLTETYDTMNNLTIAIKGTIDQMISLRNDISGLPTELANLAKSRKKWIETCNSTIREFKISKNMSSKFTQWLYEKLY